MLPRIIHPISNKNALPLEGEGRVGVKKFFLLLGFSSLSLLRFYRVSPCFELFDGGVNQDIHFGGDGVRKLQANIEQFRLYPK